MKVHTASPVFPFASFQSISPPSEPPVRQGLCEPLPHLHAHPRGEGLGLEVEPALQILPGVNYPELRIDSA